MGNDATDDATAGRPNPAKPETAGASRREPPVIDAKAQDITAAAKSAAPASDAGKAPAAAAGSSAAPKTAEAPPAAATTEPVKPAAAPTGGAATAKEPQQTAPAQPGRSGGGWRIAAAVILTLALVGAGAAGAWHWRAADPALAEAQKAIVALQARVDALDGKVAAGPAAISALDKRVAAMEASVKAADAAARGATTASDAARMAAEGARASAEAALANAAKALEAPKATDVATPVQTPVAAPVAAAAPPVDLAPLEQRLAAIETRSPVDLVPLAQRVAGVESLGLRVATLEKRVPALEAMLSQPKTDQRALETREPGLPSLDQGAAAVAVAENLARAVDRGAPFETELAALRRLGAKSDAMAALDAISTKGAPSLAALNEAFRAAKPAMLAALKPKPASTAETLPAPAEAGYWQRISQAASGFVRIRKAGEPAPPAPESVIAPIETALARGDVDGALGLRDKLPEAARAASQDWAAATRLRLEAARNAHAVLAGTIAALNKPK